ncbi:hypothetical protein [Modestobacter sp. SYSU DS0511]
MTRIRRCWLAALFPLVMVFVFLLGASQSAQAQEPGDMHPGCTTQTDLVHDLDVQRTDRGFVINIVPTDSGRYIGGGGTVEVWHTIQGCVAGLYGDLADSIWQQLDCHMTFGPLGGGGDVFELESWAPPLSFPTLLTYVTSNCLNDPPGQPYEPKPLPDVLVF